MKFDKSFSSVRVCPETNFFLSEDGYAYSKGICPVCGNISGNTFTHAKQLSGKWYRPSWFERVFQKKVAKFYSKEDLEIMNVQNT